MSQAEFSPNIRLTALLEGVPLPVLMAQFSFKVDSPAVISLTLPYVPLLDPISHRVFKSVDGGVDDQGLTILNDIDLKGVQPDTYVQIFAYDDLTDIDQFVVEGRLFGKVTQSHVGPQHLMTITAAGSANFMSECHRYMVDRGSSMGLETSDWKDQLGTLSYSDLSAKLKEKGLAEGLMDILKDAGLNTTERLHILWRLQRLERRINIVSNPKALGYFEGSRLEKILEKTVNKMTGTAPVSQLLFTILQLLDYEVLNIPCPSFLNPKFDSEEKTIHEVVLENPYDVLVGDLLMMPDIGQLSPPPRFNVIFTCDYQDWQNSIDFGEIPTRMIARVGGRGGLQTNSSTQTTIILPQELEDGIKATEGENVSEKKKGRYFNLPQERYSGVVHHNASLNRPEYVGDMGSEYIKQYMELQYYKAQHVHHTSLSSNFLNFSVVPGFPSLVLARNGQHKIGRLSGVTMSYVAGSSQRTDYHFDGMRPYQEPVTANEGGAWLEHRFFAPEHIGSYLYPRLVGLPFEDEIPRSREAEDTYSDLSILAHLLVADMSDEDLRAAKTDPLAIKNATDKLYEMYNQSPNKFAFARAYGRRTPITKNQWLSDFMRCKWSQDGKIALGGVSIRTSAVSLEDMGDLEIGDKIPDDAKIAGCYIRERQEVYFEAYSFFQENWNVPVDVTYFDGEILNSDKIDNLVEEATRNLLNGATQAEEL